MPALSTFDESLEILATIPHQPSRATVDDSRSIAALIGFGIPFAAYDASGRRLYASSRALDLLGHDETDSASWYQVANVVRGALSRSRGRTAAPGYCTPATAGSYAIGVCLSDRSTSGIAAVAVFHPMPERRSRPFDLTAYGLTAREQEVACLIAEGSSTKQIAARLEISCHTARRHTERVFAKLGVRARIALTLLFRERWPSSSALTRSSARRISFDRPSNHLLTGDRP